MTTPPFEQTTPPVGAEMAEFIAEDRAVLFERIRATAPVRRAHRKRRFIAGGLAVGVIAAGGAAAYAALDTPPPFVSEGSKSAAREHGQTLAPPNMLKIVDLTLPDGSRFGAWHGKSKDLECDASADNWDGRGNSGSGGLGCAPAVDDGHSLIRLNWAAGKGDVTDKNWVPEPWFPVAYGWVPNQDVVGVKITGRLRVTGKVVDLVAGIDPKTRGFGVVLPGSVDNKHYPMDQIGEFSGLTLRFLDAKGHEVLDPVPLNVMQ